jgi:hypothetical protein
VSAHLEDVNVHLPQQEARFWSRSRQTRSNLLPSRCRRSGSWLRRQAQLLENRLRMSGEWRWPTRNLWSLIPLESRPSMKLCESWNWIAMVCFVDGETRGFPEVFFWVAAMLVGVLAGAK